MFTKNILFKNFKKNSQNSKIKNKLKSLLSEDSQILKSLSKNYVNNFSKKNLEKYKKNINYRIIGMGGSSLGAKAIYDFLKHKIKKNFVFVDNLRSYDKKVKKKHLNLVISKSGNTLETIVNANVLIKKNEKNIFITENKNSYLNFLAKKLKSEVIHHNNYIGGRFSVLSEVGMLPAELMGLNSNNFKQYNDLVKNKNFLNHLIVNVDAILHYHKKKKFNSIIINYDEKSESLFKWYQQLVAESLGKKNLGILPVVSNMPKDNHSVMQLYLNGFKNNFFTFFYVKERNSLKLNSREILPLQKNLKNNNIDKIIFAQKKATENVFNKKNIPFRSFELNLRNEKTISEMFCFFILETILIGKMLKINTFNQPAVEQIKNETMQILI